MVEPAEHLAPLQPIIGRWRSSGVIVDGDGKVLGQITGSDTYTWLPGGQWIVHEVDVLMDQERVQTLDLIGGREEVSGGWHMIAFDTADQPGRMTLTVQEPGLLLLQGDGVRSWFRPQAGSDHMTTLWKREVDGRWLPWMDMRFDRGRPPT